MVGISLLTLVPGVVGGSETYVRELTRALARVGELEYRLYLPSIAQQPAWDLPAAVVRSYPSSRSTAGRLRAMGKATVMPGSIRRELLSSEPSCIHFPLTVMIPRTTTPPAVTSILDVQHEYHPEFFSRTELGYRRFLYARTARDSVLIIAISNHAKATIVDRLDVDPDRIRVIHLGVDTTEFHPGDRQREPFVLYPANRWPHKNHERLVAGFRLVRSERLDLRLVLTGRGLDDLELPPGVEALGHVPRKDLIDLYRRASALVFPSLYEGFGQPVIEAMACGCPVASSNAAALPEVCDGAARLFDATSVEEIATAILEVVTRPDDLVARGKRRAAQLSWTRAARAHDAVYRELDLLR